MNLFIPIFNIIIYQISMQFKKVIAAYLGMLDCGLSLLRKNVPLLLLHETSPIVCLSVGGVIFFRLLLSIWDEANKLDAFNITDASPSL